MRPNQTYKLLHSKENHKQNEKTTLEVGGNKEIKKFKLVLLHLH